MPLPPDQPRVIILLDIALSPTLYPPRWVADALKELNEIRTSWHSDRNLSALRERLGVTAKRGGQRTWAAYLRHIQILDSLRKAASAGKDVSTYRKAADATDVDEKSIERTWKNYGLWFRELLSKDVDQLDDARANAIRGMILLLPP